MSVAERKVSSDIFSIACVKNRHNKQWTDVFLSARNVSFAWGNCEWYSTVVYEESL